MININLPYTDLEKIIRCLDHRLYDMDQEHHFFREEPSKEYFELIKIRDYLLGFTDSWNHVESKDPAG